ncbi:MAG: primosomal protein N', partial [Alphaproteobacteria bacterium]
LPVERTYPYTLSADPTDHPDHPDHSAPAGTWVEVQAASRKTFGVVWHAPLNVPPPAPTAPDAGESTSKAKNIRPIQNILPAPPLGLAEREFLSWSAEYTITPAGKLLRAFAPVRKALDSAYIDTPAPRGEPLLPTLNDEQQAAVQSLIARHGNGFSTTLLQGVTGAGKGEVYLEAVRDTLKRGHQALILLPEISLSSDWQHRIQDRLGFAPLIWHSAITPAKRRKTWQAAASGAAPLIVGARSALFLPLPKLGLIIVDEEHDSSYKQEDGIIYSARDLGVARARAHGVPCVLVSATPSLETLVNVERGKYQLLNLPRRHHSLADSKPPVIRAVDLRAERPQSPQLPELQGSKASRKASSEPTFLSPPLVDAIGERLAVGEQSLLFLNRRGYAPLVLCSACGYRLQCPDCSTWMVFHNKASFVIGRGGSLLCHYCGHRRILPRDCGSCQESDGWVVCGPGVERIAREVGWRFPRARVAVVSSDTISAAREMAGIFDKIRTQQLDILVGTQILGKGHHFPLMTLVGIVDADIGLGGGDLRALEKSWQLLTQVAGRARGQDGAEGSAGGSAKDSVADSANVFVQTRLPQHPVMRALVDGDTESFIIRERAARQEARMPPFARLAALVLSSLDLDVLESYGGALAGAVNGVKSELGSEFSAVRVLGPAPAPISFLRRRHRHRLLVQSPLNVRIQDFIRPWIDAVRRPQAVRCVIDIDPYSFL